MSSLRSQRSVSPFQRPDSPHPYGQIHGDPACIRKVSHTGQQFRQVLRSMSDSGSPKEPRKAIEMPRSPPRYGDTDESSQATPTTSAPASSDEPITLADVSSLDLLMSLRRDVSPTRNDIANALIDRLGNSMSFSTPPVTTISRPEERHFYKEPPSPIIGSVISIPPPTPDSLHVCRSEYKPHTPTSGSPIDPAEIVEPFCYCNEHPPPLQAFPDDFSTSTASAPPPSWQFPTATDPSFPPRLSSSSQQQRSQNHRRFSITGTIRRWSTVVKRRISSLDQSQILTAAAAATATAARKTKSATAISDSAPRLPLIPGMSESGQAVGVGNSTITWSRGPWDGDGEEEYNAAMEDDGGVRRGRRLDSFFGAEFSDRVVVDVVSKADSAMTSLHDRGGGGGDGEGDGGLEAEVEAEETRRLSETDEVRTWLAYLRSLVSRERSVSRGRVKARL